MYGHTHKCGRRSKGRYGAARCTITRLRLAPGMYAPACARHLELDERRALGLLPGLDPVVPAPRRPERLDVAKLRAGDRD